ncbi:MAG: lactate utilization protein [Firmicutes bacterium]|nr:lactate utilization protein [Bacillota bacterium]
MNKELFDKRNSLYGPTVVKALETRGFEAYYCANKEEALEKAVSVIPKDHSVGWGGSMSINEIGLVDRLRRDGYTLIDRDLGKTPEEKTEIMRKALTADTFIMGTNALTEAGELLNVDGTGNRVAALCFGPKSVVVIAGINKVTRDMDAAVKRVRTIAAPINAARFPGLKTPCAVTGKCGECTGDGCICVDFLITRKSNPKGRIKVILVGEELGF